VIGAGVIAAVVAAFVFLVPFAEDNVEQRGGLDEAGRFIVDDYTAMELADGWSVDSRSELFSIVTDGTYQLILPVSNPADATPEGSLEDIHDTYSADPANVVTPIETFSTDAGGDAAGYRALIASDPSGNGAAFFAVVDNGRSFQPAFTGPADLDDPLYDAAEAMVRTIVISAMPREGGS
jgi:hypothetical protein